MSYPDRLSSYQSKPDKLFGDISNIKTMFFCHIFTTKIAKDIKIFEATMSNAL